MYQYIYQKGRVMVRIWLPATKDVDDRRVLTTGCGLLVVSTKARRLQDWWSRSRLPVLLWLPPPPLLLLLLLWSRSSQEIAFSIILLYPDDDDDCDDEDWKDDCRDSGGDVYSVQGGTGSFSGKRVGGSLLCFCLAFVWVMILTTEMGGCAWRWLLLWLWPELLLALRVEVLCNNNCGLGVWLASQVIFWRRW